jgi:hypothetical protein
MTRNRYIGFDADAAIAGTREDGTTTSALKSSGAPNREAVRQQ